MLLGAPFPLCLASRTACPSCPLPHASSRARGLRHADSPRAEKATLQHLQVAGAPPKDKTRAQLTRKMDAGEHSKIRNSCLRSTAR